MDLLLQRLDPVRCISIMGLGNVDSHRLRRVFTTADNNVKALYDDDSVLLLSSEGDTFTSIDPSGTSTTQLTLFALKRHHVKLAEVLSFRNLHVAPPLHVPPLCHSTHSLGYSITSVSWPTSPAEAAAEGLLHSEPDGSLSVDSKDHAARVVLHLNRSRLAVCFPLLVCSNQDRKHDYIWHTQLFAVWECPDCWQYPLALLQIASQKANTSQHRSTSQEPVTDLQHEQLAADSTSALPRASCPGITLRALPKHSWYQDCSDSLPSDIAIKLDWTPDTLYQYSPSTQEVAVWIHADGSCLQSEQEGRFFRYSLGHSVVERLYAAEAVPVHTSTSSSKSLPLAAMANHATALRQLGIKTAARQSLECSPESNSLEQSDVVHLEEAIQLCEQVHEQHDVHGVGKFTAFQDGSVHVAFEDRALLYMQPGGSHCNVINPEGQKTSVATANPLGVEQYVLEAVEFAAWAFSSPAQRSAVLQQAASIQKELDKCQRSALLCDWAQGHSVVVHHTNAELSGETDSAVGYHAGHVHDVGGVGLHSFDTVHAQLDTAARQHVIDSVLANNSRLVSTL